MAEKFIKATEVRLVQPAKGGDDRMTSDWSDRNTHDLVVFPDTGIARGVMPNGKVRIAKFASADVDEESQRAWEKGRFECSICNQSFENTQALGSHKQKKHQS
jgi:hypothetical protein